MLEDSPDAAPDTRLLMLRLQELLENARAMPLSSSVMVNKEEFGELLQDAIDGLPEELRQARWLLKEREDVLERANREADRIIEAARVRAERMVERTEVTREARKMARQVVDAAEERARRLQHEAEDFCDQKLAQFEIVLDRTIRTVQAGRSRLQAAVPAEEDERSADGGEPEFFDQDDL